MINLDMRNIPDHHPRRDDQVAAWIKDRRDQYEESDGKTECWTALDSLLDEYRLAADTGQSLEEIVNAEWREEHPPVAEKKKKRPLSPIFEDHDRGEFS